MKRRAAVAAALVVTLAARETVAEIYHLKSPSTLKTEKGSELKLPPGYFLDEEAWQERDARMKKLEADRTRFRAENQALRKHINSGGDTRFYVVTLAVGMFAGFVGYQMITK